MPRTKLSKKAKKPVTVNKENSKELIIREFETLSEELNYDMEADAQQAYESLEDAINAARAKIPPTMLSITLGEIMAEKFNTFNQCNESRLDDLPSDRVMGNQGYGSMSSLVSHGNFSIKSTKTSRTDEGYLTEDSTANMRIPLQPKGPLSAKPLHRMPRSQSSSAVKQTPLQPTLSARTNTIQKVLPGTTTKVIGRQSRPRARNPTNSGSRVKAASVDRLKYITPKFHTDAPVSLLRHARAGETLISATGSPVVAGSFMDPTPNLNIPLEDGFVAVRAVADAQFDRRIISRINPETLEELKLLHRNMSQILQMTHTK